MTSGHYMQRLGYSVRRVVRVWLFMPAFALAQVPPSKPAQAEVEAQVRELRHTMALRPSDAAVLYRLIELFGILAEDYEVESGRQLYQAENALRYAKQVTRAAPEDPRSFYWLAQASLLWGTTNGVQNSVHLVPSIQRALDRCATLGGTTLETVLPGQNPVSRGCARLRAGLLADWPRFPVSAGNPAAAEKLVRALISAEPADVESYFVALPMAVRANDVVWARELATALAVALAQRRAAATARPTVADRYLIWKAGDVLVDAQQWLGSQKP